MSHLISTFQVHCGNNSYQTGLDSLCRALPLLISPLVGGTLTFIPHYWERERGMISWDRSWDNERAPPLIYGRQVTSQGIYAEGVKTELNQSNKQNTWHQLSFDLIFSFDFSDWLDLKRLSTLIPHTRQNSHLAFLVSLVFSFQIHEHTKTFSIQRGCS